APPALSAHDPLPRPASPRPARRPRSPPRICHTSRFINIIIKLHIKLLVSTLDCRYLRATAADPHPSDPRPPRAKRRPRSAQRPPVTCPHLSPAASPALSAPAPPPRRASPRPRGAPRFPEPPRLRPPSSHGGSFGPRSTPRPPGSARSPRTSTARPATSEPGP